MLGTVIGDCDVNCQENIMLLHIYAVMQETTWMNSLERSPS